MRSARCLLLGWIIAGPAWAQAPTAIVATVNGEAVTQKEVLEEVMVDLLELQDQYLYDQRAAAEMVNRRLQDGLDRLILRRLVLKRAKAETDTRIQVSDDDVDREVRRLARDASKRGGLNLRGVDDYYRAVEEVMGIRREAFREKVRERILVERYYALRLADIPVVSPDEVRELWARDPTAFRKEGSVTIRQVFIPRQMDGVAAADREDLVAAVESELEKDKRPAAFVRLVAKYSQDARKERGGIWRLSLADPDTGSLEGDLDGFLDNLHRGVAEAVRKMKEGETSGAIETTGGTHFVHMIERKDAEPMTFEEAQRKIERRLLAQRRYRRRLEFQRRLLEDAEVERFPENLWPK